MVHRFVICVCFESNINNNPIEGMIPSVCLLGPYLRKKSLKTSFLQELLKRKPLVIKQMDICCIASVTQENTERPVNIFQGCLKMETPTCTYIESYGLLYCFCFVPKCLHKLTNVNIKHQQNFLLLC